jgi:hypothetical protein
MEDSLTLLQPIANFVCGFCEEEDLSSLSSAERTFLLVWAFGAEVDNGGLEQFFCNSMGAHAWATVRALHEVGAFESARVLDAANHLFGSAGPPLDLEKRNDALDRVLTHDAKRLELLTKEYFDSNEDHLLLLRHFVELRPGVLRTTDA